MENSILVVLHDSKCSFCEDSSVIYRSPLGESSTLENDYRYHQYHRFVECLQLNKHQVVQIDIAKHESVDTIDNSFIESFLATLVKDYNRDISLSLFFISFVNDLKLVFRFITKLIHYLTSSPISVLLNFTLIEDLLYVSRPYIFTNVENNFIRNFLQLSEKFSLSSLQKIEIKSTNQLMNKWGEGDTRIIEIPEIVKKGEEIWLSLFNEIDFQEMFNQGNAVPRLINIQTIQNNYGGLPIYRHPNDEEPINHEMYGMTLYLKSLVEKYTQISGINHVLIQYYRDGRDNIASHSDKTLDIDRNTPIINLSIGSSREMFIQSKDNKNRIEKIPLNHSECIIFGLKTNQYWWHEIPKFITLKDHPIYGKGRISFTFRKITTFIYPQYNGLLIGQGSPYKQVEDLSSEEIKSKAEEIAKKTRSDLIIAFSKENRQSNEFDWEAAYGEGFVCK
jgi:hypothetical protein